MLLKKRSIEAEERCRKDGIDAIIGVDYDQILIRLFRFFVFFVFVFVFVFSAPCQFGCFLGCLLFVDAVELCFLFSHEYSDRNLEG